MICPFCCKIIQESFYDGKNNNSYIYYRCMGCRYVCSLFKDGVVETFKLTYPNDNNEYKISHIFYDVDNQIYYVSSIDELSGWSTILFEIKNQHIDSYHRYDPIYWKSLIMML